MVYIYESNEEAKKVARTARKHLGHDARVVGSAVICTADQYNDVMETTYAPEALLTAEEV